ncbi:MAG: Hsp70 family protein, partial [Flammeovirgaceae bacterium]
MKVLAEAWDKQLGGRNFNYNLIRYLMKRFDEYPQRKGKGSVLNNPKIAEKILAEAIKVKEILSANKEVKVQVLTLEDNINLQEELTRETFEKINSEEINRAYDTIAQVLTFTNKTIDE